ncbi:MULTISPECIES: DUF475 domain-containing protein [unclassified Methanoregula]|uniref:DUF475 domain-containing protein n=1 Tax=unclassified Methanoregula TaxID=2649730 RepID=UPI0009C8EF67|nr:MULTISPECIES: DUF475 domain-containing protein [unclassified Methanoregula]OPX62822.1 MAG: Integral membrane protein TerC family protein [Methanoregula sp. PtaB.Bin085]OPY35259.1 MAG: Integral membrane protein TerC family protein [Methanoregula sp. PtaU1.Bin006]
MDLIAITLIVAGLVLFETITSIDNAIINAEVLSTMSERAKRWFLIWGLLFAVFAIRGLLPWLIVLLTTPALGPVGALTATFSSDPLVIGAIEQSAPILLIGGGTFLIFLFFHWLFLETKHFGLRGERYFSTKGVWFFAIVSILLSVIVWFALEKNPLMGFGAVVGSTAFFIVHGFRQNAELAEHRMLHDSGMSDVSKIFYLEVIDATFSIDGVIGAFAFTMAVPLILVGNGIGAFVVRELTIRNVDNIKRYKYLKNGAMYSILFLGTIMILDSFGFHIPFWLSPLITFGVVGFFMYKSIREMPEEHDAGSGHAE